MLIASDRALAHVPMVYGGPQPHCSSVSSIKTGGAGFRSWRNVAARGCTSLNTECVYQSAAWVYCGGFKSRPTPPALTAIYCWPSTNIGHRTRMGTGLNSLVPQFRSVRGAINQESDRSYPARQGYPPSSACLRFRPCHTARARLPSPEQDPTRQIAFTVCDRNSFR